MSMGGKIRAGAAFVEIYLQDGKLVRGLQNAQRKLRAFSIGMQSLGQNMLKISGVMATPLALSARTFAGFSDQMAEVKAVTGIAGEAFGKLNEQAKTLGRTTSFTASEVAQGMTELGRAGYSASEIMAAIPSVLDLSRGTATDLGEAASIAAAAMRGFNLSADDTTRIADVLSATANGSAQTLTDVGEAMKYVAPLAMEAGATIEDTAAALAVMANNGIKGSMAGTALARAYKNLSTKGAQDTLAGLGISAVDARGDLRGVAEIMEDLGKATASMGNAQKLSIFENLFGRGSAAALKLASPTANLEGLQKKIAESNGVAKATAKTMDDTLGGSFRMLMSAVEGVQIAIGEALQKTLRRWMDRLAEVAAWITQLVMKNRDLIVGVLKITAVVGAAGAALMAAGTAGLALAGVMGGLGSIIGLAGTAVSILGTTLAALLSPIGLVMAGVGALAAYLITSTEAGGKALQWLAGKFEALRAFASDSITGIGDALATGDLRLAATILWAGLKTAWQKGVYEISRIFYSVKEAVLNTMTDAVYGAVALWYQGVARIKRAVAEIRGFIKSVQSAVQDAATKVLVERDYKQRIADIDERVASGKMSSADASAMKQALTEQHAINMGNIDADTAKRNAAIESEKNEATSAANAERDAMLVGTAQAMQSEKDARRSEYEKNLAESEKELNAAKAEWRKAVDEAKSKRDASLAGDTAPDGPGDAKTELDQAIDGMKRGGQATLNAMDRAAEVRGTFNPAAVLGLQSSGTEERTAKAAEETARNTKRLLDESQSGGLVFA